MTGSRRKVVKQTLIVVGVLFVFYLGTYITLSSLGGYYLNQSGKFRYQAGKIRYRNISLPVSDISTWNPKGCRFQYRFENIKGEYVSRGNDLGYFFAPLIILDRRFIHPTEVLIESKNPDETDRFPL